MQLVNQWRSLYAPIKALRHVDSDIKATRLKIRIRAKLRFKIVRTARNDIHKADFTRKTSQEKLFL